MAEKLIHKTLDTGMMIQNDFLCESIHSPTLCIDKEGVIFSANQGACELTGYQKTEIAQLPLDEIFLKNSSTDDVVNIHNLSSKVEKELQLIHKNGDLIPVSFRVARDTDLENYFLMLFDLSEIRKTEEKLSVQVERMQALGNIDRAIISTMDLDFITDVVFDQISSQLQVECSMLFLNAEDSRELTCQHSRGLHLLTNNGNQSGNPEPILAQRILASGEVLIIGDISSSWISKEELPSPYRNIKFYAGVPLHNLGETIGVLEVCSQESFSPDSDWISFLNMIAGQTAIAIVHVKQFHDIRRLNSELLKSYESTLEGWARVLEFKDHETKGHSDRVTQMAMKLGKAMGLTTDELTHLRRGAVLHDIGKLCVPEEILFKAGPLDDIEWETMKQHPIYAQEFVADIQFLQPATNILLFHHERWDGSGYPLGLKGKQIPLAARIFMVIDVWDALSFDRPYRKAWNTKKVRQYLRENAGKLFDPEVIDVFLEITE